MSELVGPSIAAMQARQTALVRQHDTVAAADCELAEMLASVHAAMREAVRRLDTIADEIGRAVFYQDEFAIDTPMGAREFQTFLVAKQREIAVIVADAHELDHVKSAALGTLGARYVASAGDTGPN